MTKRKFFALVAVMTCGIMFAAGELDDAVLHGETDKERAIDYRPEGHYSTCKIIVPSFGLIRNERWCFLWRKNISIPKPLPLKESATISVPIQKKTWLAK